MKKIIIAGLLSGLGVLIFIIIFTNIFGVDPSTIYINVIEDTIFREYHLDIILAGFIILALVLAYNKANKS